MTKIYRIKNTADDRTKVLQHRLATGFQMEPSLGGHRIRLGQFLDIAEDHYLRVKEMVDSWVAKGMVEVSVVGNNISKYPPPSVVEEVFVPSPQNVAAVAKLELETLPTVAEVTYSVELPIPLTELKLDLLKDEVSSEEETKPKKGGRPKKSL